MAVSAISAGSSASSFVTASRVEQLAAQIQTLNLQLAQIQANRTMDAATKQQRTQSLQAQIRQLEVQLNRLQQSQANTAAAVATATTNAAPATIETVGSLFSAYA